MKKDTIIYIVTIVISLLYVFIANKLILKGEGFFNKDDSARFYIAEVISVGESITSDYGETTTDFTAKILKGEYKNKVVSAIQMLDSFASTNSRKLKEKDKIYLYKHDASDEVVWYADQYDRVSGLSVLAVIFVAFILIFGRKKRSKYYSCVNIYLHGDIFGLYSCNTKRI